MAQKEKPVEAEKSKIESNVSKVEEPNVKPKAKVTTYVNEDDLIEQSKATLAAVDQSGTSKALGNLDIDLLNKLTQNA